MAYKTIHLNISGMTCVNCSNGIEKFLQKKEGIKEVHVSFASSEGEFTINTNLYSEENLISDIKKLGYDVQFNQKALEKQQLIEFNKLRNLFIVSILFTIGIFILHFGNLFEENLNMLTIFILASVVQFYAGLRFYQLSYKALQNKNYDMNVLVALGTSAAYGYSTFVVFFPQYIPVELRFVYFDGAAVIISFVLLGRYLEENSKQKASDFLKKLMQLVPSKANLLLDNGEIQEVESKELTIGDKIVIKAGEVIPIDGKIIEGESYINTAMITGESLPIFKEAGSEVLSGTINTNGILIIETLKVTQDTTLHKIIQLLKTAQSKQIPISRFADKIANIFVPTVIAISIITFIIWSIFGNIENAIIASISVLIISCPCALGLATPIAIVSSVSRGAKEGILIKNPEILEVIKDIEYAVFDKTGTLTQGIISVTSTNIENKYLPFIASIENLSEHPISKAIVNFVKEKKLFKTQNVIDMKILKGEGVKAIIDNNEILVGNLSLLEKNDIDIKKEHLDFFNDGLQKGHGVVLVAVDKKSIGSFNLEDKLKHNAKEVVSKLKEKSITPVLLTGDNETTANYVSKVLGIQSVYSQVLPTEKYAVIQNLQKSAKVMFIGDGINDAPSIKQADIGITLNSGSDITKDAGDIILVNNDLNAIPKSINLSVKTLTIVKQNLFWAFFYNTLGIPIAAGLLYPFFGIMLTPMYAGIAMSFSSVCVVLNSLRLKSNKL